MWHTPDMAKRPRDPAQLAKQVFDIAIGEAEDTVSGKRRHPAVQRAGGLAGSLEDMIEMTDSYMPKPGKRGPYKKQPKA